MKAWIKMFISLVAVWGFVKIAPIALTQINSYKQVVEHSEEMGIDNSTLFYSEEPLTSTAEHELKKRLNLSNEKEGGFSRK